MLDRFRDSFPRLSLGEDDRGSISNDEVRKMEKIQALKEIVKMWIWLYKHPAHDRAYYVNHVVKLDKPWKNFCPLCDLENGKCPDCLMKYEEQKGTFCSDPESPLQKWKATPLDYPDSRTMHSGSIIAIAQNALRKQAATH